MTTKDGGRPFDGGPFHPNQQDGRPFDGASFRDVAAMHNQAAILSSHNFRISFGEKAATMSAKCAVEATDALIAELKK